MHIKTSVPVVAVPLPCAFAVLGMFFFGKWFESAHLPFWPAAVISFLTGYTSTYVAKWIGVMYGHAIGQSGHNITVTKIE